MSEDRSDPPARVNRQGFAGKNDPLKRLYIAPLLPVSWSNMLLQSLIATFMAFGSWVGPARVQDPPEQTPPTEAPAEPPAAQPETTPAPTQASEKSAVRDRVLSSIGRTLRRRAFVPGIDFTNWTELTQSQIDKLHESSDREFVRSVNRLLGSYKVSHLQLVPPEQRSSPNPAARAQPGTPKPDDMKASNATLRWIGDDAAVLKLRSFDDDLYDRDRVEAIFAEIKPKAKHLVIDLRNNGGGAVSALTHFLSQILPESTAIGVYVNKDMSSRFERAQGRPSADPMEIAKWSDRKFRVRRGAMGPFTGNVAVLINRGSASASEITAAALRDHGNAALLGQPSAGKVLMSIHANLSEGYKLQVPTSDYITTRGVRLEGNPIRPHVILPSGRRREDRAAEEAVSLLSQGL